jgi:hypothetical protein
MIDGADTRAGARRQGCHDDEDQDEVTHLAKCSLTGPGGSPHKGAIKIAVVTTTTEQKWSKL